MALDRYKITLKGTQFRDGTGLSKTVVVWSTGIEDKPENVGESSKHTGYVTNHSPSWARALEIPLIPIGLTLSSVAGHDHTVYLALEEVIEFPYVFISGVEGMDIIGPDALTQFWAALLAMWNGLYPIEIRGLDVNIPKDNTKLVSILARCRYPGLKVTV